MTTIVYCNTVTVYILIVNIYSSEYDVTNKEIKMSGQPFIILTPLLSPLQTTVH